MKSIKFLLTLITIVLSFATCIDPEDIIEAIPDPNADENKPEPTSVGFPIGLPTSKIIGASGGTLSDVDGIITVDIPAGALSGDTEITIQPITNFAPNGNGNAYQLMPEGIKFNKPIKITFKHGREISSVIPALTGIAFQDTDGIWYSTGKFKWDTTNKTVSTETNHFSGWATFDVLKIFGSAKFFPYEDLYKMKVNESEEFYVKVINSETLTPVESDELTPLIKKDNNDYKAIVKEWLANGKPAVALTSYGKIKPYDEGCTYTAPQKRPSVSENPVNLSVTLKDLRYKDPRTGQVFKDLQLVTAIEIVGEYHFNVEIKYNHPSVVGFGNFANTDLATLKVHVNGDSEVIVSDITNADGKITPDSFTGDGCTTTLISQDNFFPGITVTETTGFVIPGVNIPEDKLNLVVRGTFQFAKFKYQCGDISSIVDSSQPTTDILPLLITTFILKDSVQTVLDPTQRWLVKLTPE